MQYCKQEALKTVNKLNILDEEKLYFRLQKYRLLSVRSLDNPAIWWLHKVSLGELSCS